MLFTMVVVLSFVVLWCGVLVVVSKEQAKAQVVHKETTFIMCYKFFCNQMLSLAMRKNVTI